MRSIDIMQVCNSSSFFASIAIVNLELFWLCSNRALMSTLGDFEFDSAQFESFAQATFSSLFTLLKEAKECDTKMSVLTCMSLTVDKMGRLKLNHSFRYIA